MKLPGLYIIIFGIVGLIASFADKSFVVFNWMDKWGDTSGLLIRIGFVIVGVIMFLGGRSSKIDQYPELSEIIEIEKHKQEEQSEVTDQL